MVRVGYDARGEMDGDVFFFIPVTLYLPGQILELSCNAGTAAAAAGHHEKPRIGGIISHGVHAVGEGIHAGVAAAALGNDIALDDDD